MKKKLLYVFLLGILPIQAQTAREMYTNNDGGNQLRAPVIGPFLTTKWNQTKGNGCDSCNNDYNKYIPLTDSVCNGDTLRSPTGCTITAIGQVMNYWKFPVMRSDRIRQIDWCNMPDSICCTEGIETPEIAKEAVARLMEMLGHDLPVLYGPGFGFLDPAIALGYLQIDFGYSLDATYLCREYHEDEWYNIIKDEIQNNRPVIYWAFAHNNPLSAHTFVCDGYNPNDETFHFNWGHGDDGEWVSLSDIYETSQNTHWNDFQCAIIKLEPTTQDVFCTHSVWLSSFYKKFYKTHSSSINPPYTVVPGTMAYLYSADPTDRYIYRTIPDGATATYQAHEEVHLRDGFTVERGADFTARIVPCPNCEENREAGSPETASAPSNTAPPETTSGYRLPATGYQPTATDLYPNPTDGEVTVGVDGEVQSIIIYTLMGLPVGGWRLLSIAPDRVTLDLSSLPAGTYILHIQTPMGISTKRLVVAR